MYVFINASVQVHVKSPSATQSTYCMSLVYIFTSPVPLKQIHLKVPKLAEHYYFSFTEGKSVPLIVLDFGHSRTHFALMLWQQVFQICFRLLKQQLKPCLILFLTFLLHQPLFALENKYLWVLFQSVFFLFCYILNC